MQPGDFTSSYHHQYPHTTPANPSPHSISYPPAPSPTAASAPFYSDTSYGSTPELSSAYHYTHPPFPHNSDPVPSLSSPISTPSYPPVPANHFPPQVTQYFPPSTPSSTLVPESTGLYPSAQQSLAPPPTHYFPYDPSPQTAPPSMTSTLSTSYPNPNPNSTSLYPSNFNSPGSSGTSLYDAIRKFDHGSGYLDENSGGYNGYGRSRSELGADGYVNRRTESGGSRDRFGPGMYGDEGYRDGGAYAYQGKTEPYGARGGTKPKSSTMFDDYGRPISSAPSLDRERSSSLKVVRAIPKAETQSDSKNGVQKFRVKLLAESGGQNTMDVLCQVGLDGIRMLDPNTSRTLRIYPLENVSRCEKFDSSTIAFWSKTSVDFEARRIRLQSNSYTTSTLLDTITAATVQFKEMGGRFKPPEPSKVAEQPTDKKKGLTDWVTRLKPTFSSYEEKDHWVPDEAVSKCTACGTDFSAFVRRHHCRNCGDVFCDKCTHGRIALTTDENAQPVRVCDRCMAEVTRRLSSARESAGRSAVVHSHEDLAKKLQDEMERNRRASSSSSSSGSKFDGSGRRMKEVACPTCTVHLQVQVPSSGSETIECGVCQHPFLVSSH